MTIIRIKSRAGEFAEDKDVAADIRSVTIMPTIYSGGNVCLDFSGVQGATQSFVHALICDTIRTYGTGVLDRIEFKACNPTIKTVIEIVVEYSQHGLDGVGSDDQPTE
jgi:hypothetical protein